MNVQQNNSLITAETPENPASSPGSHGQKTDKELVDWLQEKGADASTIEKVNLHNKKHSYAVRTNNNSSLILCI